MTDFSDDDVSAMRRQGDLRAFMRQQIADGAARRDAKPKPVTHRPPGHQPGAWPAGCQPPAPPAPLPPAAWAAALDEYRDWLAVTDRPELDTRRYPCDCPACQLLDGGSDDPRS